MSDNTGLFIDFLINKHHFGLPKQHPEQNLNLGLETFFYIYKAIVPKCDDT